MKSTAKPLVLATRDDWIRVGQQLMAPWVRASEAGVDRYDGELPTSGARPFARWFEGLVRPMALGAPLLAATNGRVDLTLGEGRTVELGDWYRQQFTMGVGDPSGSNAWLVSTRNMDQTIVETALLTISLVVARRYLWDPLPSTTKAGLAAWMDRVSHQMTLNINNWNIFPIMTQLGLRQLGMPYDRAMVDGLLEQVERFYHADGWYADGFYRQFDYYVPEAIYMLLIAGLWIEDGGALREKVFGRAAEFARSFALFFDGQGRNICFGRSRSYRFSASYFWAMCGFANVPGVNQGLCRSIVAGNIAWFLNQPIFAADGRLAGGHATLNDGLNEGYIGPGSCAWAFQSFLPLALPPDSPFWTAPEPNRVRPVQQYVAAPNIVLTRDASGHNATLFNGGIHHPFDFGGHTQKYGKFAYSSHFGFNTAGNRPDAVFDNMISLSQTGQPPWSHRYRFEVCPSQGNWLISRHCPFDGDSESVIETALVVRGPWHVRVHRLRLTREYHIREGGTPVRNQEKNSFEEPDQIQSENGIVLRGINGCVGGWCLSGGLRPERSGAELNVNVLYRRVFIPVLAGVAPAGRNTIATGWYCSTNPGENVDLLCPPVFESANEDAGCLTWPDETRDVLNLNAIDSGPLKIITGGGFPWSVDCAGL